MGIKTHKKIIYIWFGWFAIVKAAIFFFGVIAWIFWIWNVFADSNDCSTLSMDNVDTYCNFDELQLYATCWNNVNICDIEDNAFNGKHSLIILDISNNQITNLRFLREIPQLAILNAENNDIWSISPLRYVSNLTKLNLSGNRISNITILSGLSNLEELTLSNNYITTTNNIFSNLASLKYLDISHNLLNNLESITESPALNSLNVQYNNIEDIDQIKFLSELWSLNIANNNIWNINSLLYLTKLSYINLWWNCIDLDENKSNIQTLSGRSVTIYWSESQRNCSAWTWQDVILTSGALIEYLNLDTEDDCNMDTVYICTGENIGICDTENYIFSWISYNVMCNTWEICQNEISFFFMNNESMQCMTWKISIWIDKVPPTCNIELTGVDKTGDNIYRPTNQSVLLSVNTTDEWIWKIAYSWYKWDEERDNSPTTIVSENNTYSVMVRDVVWNETGCSITVSNIDREPPAPATGNESMCFSWSTNITFSETDHETWLGFGWSYIVYSTWSTQLSCSSEIWENWTSKNFIETTDVHIWVCDEAGNITTGEYTYARDRAPITTISGYNRQWTWENVLLKFNIDDWHKLCKKTIDSKTYYCMYTSWESECSDMSMWENTNVNCGSWSVCQTYIKYYSVNGSWMTESTKTWLIKIDKEAPNCTLSQNPTSDNYTSGTVVLLASANDWIWSNNIQYNWASVFGSNTQSGVFSNWNYSLTVKDLVWNEKSCKIEVSNIDKIKPIITTNPWNDSSPKKSREITIIANDNLAWFTWNQSFKYYWSDVSTCTTNENSYTQSKNFDSYEIGNTSITWAITKSEGDGQKYLCVFWWIQDRAGNTSITSKGWSYLFDNTGPSWNIQISYNWNTLYASGYRLELTLTWSDTYSAISGMQFSCNNTNWTNIETFTENKSFNLSEYKNFGCDTWDWEKKIYVKFIDSLWNIWGTISGSIILDTTAPNCTIIQSACTSGNLLLTLTWNETITWSNLDNWTFVNNSKYTIWVSSNNTVSVIISDLAWNTKNCSITPTNYDNDGPSITFENTEIDECTSKTWSANAEDIWCAWITANSAFNFSTINFGNGTRWWSTFNISKELVLGGWTTKAQTLIVRDTLWNESTKTAILTIKDTKPSIWNITWEISWLLTWEIIYWNIVSILNVQDGACSTWTITWNLVWECTNATGSNLQNNVLTIKPNQNIEWTGICTIEFKDDEWNSITWFVTYNIDTRRPEKAICTENACFKDSVTVSCSESVAEPGNKIVYSTSDDISCNSPIRSEKSFSSSTTLKVAVCDTVWHISEIDTYSYLLDNQSPNTTLSGLPIWWTWNNLNLWVEVQDNCEKADTYYCIVDKGDNDCTYSKVDSHNIIVSCNDGEVCEKELWYYSKDDAWNQETKKIENIQIDRKELTCEITFDDGICTNSNINLTLDVSKPIINDLWSRTMDPDHSNKYYRTINWDGEISVDVYDHINNTYTCTAYVNNFDENTPIVYTQDLYTGYECEDIAISPVVSDEWCSNNLLTYIWDNITWDTTYLVNWENSNNLDINNIDLKVIDAAGNNTNKKIKYQWINIPITGQDFEVNDVWTGISVNWKQKAWIHAWTCESGLIEANLVNSWTMWDCILNWDILQYLPYTGMIWNDICTLSISDWDGDIPISAIWKWIDNDRPMVIEYTWWFGDICTIQQNTDIILSFSEGVDGITEESLTWYNIDIINFSSWNNWSEYLRNIKLIWEGTWEVWIINFENIKDSAGNYLSWIIEHMYLWYHDVIWPTTPSLLNYTWWEISENASITIQWQDSSTTWCAKLEKYEIIVCSGMNMSEWCKTYESYTNKKTIVKENWEYYRKVVAIDTNDNRSDFEIWHFKINSNKPTCFIESIWTCTSGSIELQLTATEPISFSDMWWITWTWSGKTWSWLINENRIINWIIIKDNENNTWTCDEFVVSSFDDQAPITSISWDFVQIDGKYWSKDNVNIKFLTIDEWCGNSEINTYYCISDTDECTDFELWNNITVTWDEDNISVKHIKYYSVDIAWNKENDKAIEITIDKQWPACEIDKNTTINTNDSILITISGHDNTWIWLNQFPYAWYSEKFWINQPTLVIWWNWLYTWYVRDLLGNESICDIDIQNIDTIPPEWVRCDIESNSCFSNSLSVICEEISNNNEDNTIVYTTDGTEPTCLSESWNNFSFTGDTILKIAVCDSVNNISDISTYTYLVDNEKPNTSVEWLPSGNGWVWDDLIISLSGFDYWCAWWTESHYCLYDSGDSCHTFTTWTEVSVSCNTWDTCIKYLEYYSIDTLWNVENTKRHVIKIDKQWPTCEINQTPASGLYTNWIVTLDANWSDWAGIKSYVWSWNLWKQKRTSVSTNWEYSVTITDTLWNQSQCSINVANIDKTSPKWVQCTPNNMCHSGNVNISCNENEHESGNYIVYTVDWSLPNCNSNSWNNINITGNNVVNVAVCDKAKNISNISTYNYNLDKKAPSTTINWVSDDWVWTDVSIDLSANDSWCANGLRTYYCIDTGNLCNPNISGKNITISCTNWDICQKYIRYYSVDALWNKENVKYKLVKINRSILSCNLHYDRNICTNTWILVHLNISEPVSGISWWNQIDEKNYEKIVNKNWSLSVTVRSALWGTYTCNTDITTYDTTAPTLDVNDEYIAYKCEDINIRASWYDNGCQWNNLKYKWNNQTWNNIKTIAWNNWYRLNQYYDIALSLTDPAGNTSNKNIKYKWTSTGLTLETEIVNWWFISSGGSYSTTISDIISKFGVKEWLCGSWNISVNTWTCVGAHLVITWESLDISYTNNFDVSCDIVFDNGEWEIITWKLLFEDDLRRDSCLSGWNNDKFLNENFWNNYAGNSTTGAQQIICAIWWASWWDITAYTKWLNISWDNKCNTRNINVIETGNLPENLVSNSIYVLNSDEITLSGTIVVPNCSAVISKKWTTLYSELRSNSGIIYLDGDFIVIDNVSLNGYINEHQFNKVWLQLAADKSHVIINNVIVLNNENWIMMDHNDHILFNNIMTYNNYDNWLSIWASAYIALNNILSFKNWENWIDLWWSEHIILNNIQTFNNSGKWILEIASNDINTSNDIRSYNEWSSTDISRSNVVNPINKSWWYLLWWTGISIKWYDTNLWQISWYSFGNSVLMQKPAMSWIWSNTWIVWNYDRNKFVASNTSNPKFNISVWKYFNSRQDILVSWDNNLIQYYSIYGDLLSHKTWIAIWTEVSLQLSGTLNNNIIIQLYGSGFFAIHSALDKFDINTSGDNYTGGWHNIDLYRYEDGDQAIMQSNWYTRELNNAYRFAYLYKITTKDDIYSADLYGSLTRIAMAKMLSNYAINILGKTPNGTNNCKFNDVSTYMDSAYDLGVSNACKLWIMWINMPNNKFRPNDTITRWEFATALSRLLYNTPDWNPYYQTHLSKLKSEWILTNTNPNLEEIRWYVMLMLMRSIIKNQK